MSAAAVVLAFKAGAHPPLSLTEKVFAPRYVLEVRVRDGKVTRSLFPPGADAPPMPPRLFVFSPGSACRAALRADPDARLLVVLRDGPEGQLTQAASVEQDKGPWTSLHPGFGQWEAAVARAAHWTEERMRAVGDAQLWQDERAALAQRENPYLAMLAARFLMNHGASDVVDAAWGLPGSAERKRMESWSRGGLDSPACPAR